MCLTWLTCSLNNILVSFLLKYFPGNIYVNGFMSCTSEFCGTVASGLALTVMDPKTCLRYSYILAACGGISMIFYLQQQEYYSAQREEVKTPNMLVFGTLILVVKFGNASAYNVLYGSTTSMFPALFSLTAFNISNFLARLCTVFAP